MLFEKILNNLTKFEKKTAFVINEIEYTYGFLKKRISTIYQYLKEKNIKKNDIIVVYTNDNIDTYASIIAIFFHGATFVPINSLHPKQRNQKIIEQIKPKLILTTTDKQEGVKNTLNLKNSNQTINLHKNCEQTAYILFTSGTTGTPKGVEVSYENINIFIEDFARYFNELNEKDRFLQIYDLTFDASLHCYLLPLFVGGSIYTVAPQKLKFLQAFKLMEKHKLTFTKFPPSVLSFLKPYFNKINLPHLKYSLLGGEEFRTDLAKEWKKSVPNSRIYNVYGPTEATINTHIYPVDTTRLEEKSNNGIVSIGKTFGQNKAVIINEENKLIKDNTIGELCLGGKQVAIGYLNDKMKNKESFFTINNIPFYKTGDLAYIDKDGDYIFLGRKDNQVQIQGYRVELSEIEEIAFRFGKSQNYAAISIKNKLGASEIILFAHKLTNKEELTDFLNKNLPSYMLPSKIINLQEFPLSPSGKVNRKELKKGITND